MWNRCCVKCKQLLADEHGASAMEYGLIAGLVAAVIILAVTGIGGSMSDVFTTICTTLGGTCS